MKANFKRIPGPTIANGPFDPYHFDELRAFKYQNVFPTWTGFARTHRLGCECARLDLKHKQTKNGMINLWKPPDLMATTRRTR